MYREMEVTHKKPHEIARLGISIVSQGRGVFSSLKVEENLTLGFRAKAGGWALEKVYELFPPLKGRAHHYGSQLSGGATDVGHCATVANPSSALDEQPKGCHRFTYQRWGGHPKLQESGLSILR
jgi:branched-chain amino acid transport system ATP-binding protein